MDKIRAPYNFVPPAPVRTEQLAHIETEDEGLQDVPFRDGISGTIDFEVEAETPIFLRGADERDKFLRLPDQTYAIPGTSIRGMLRNVVEIASASRLWLFNDHALSIRDLTPAARPVYGSQMAQIARTPSGRREPVPVVSAGWLRRKRAVEPGEQLDDDEVVATVSVCDFAKVEYNFLVTLARSRQRTFTPGERQRSRQKYDAWGRTCAALGVALRKETRRARGARSDGNVPFLGEAARVTYLGERGTAELDGYLVFTGQPNVWHPERRGGSRAGNPKHHDFVFYREAGIHYRELPVTYGMFRRFCEAHADRGQQARLADSPNAEWAFWRGVYERSTADGHELGPEQAVPVFVLPKANAGEPELRAFGLAMMFRLAYDFSVGYAVTNVQPEARDASKHDLATTLFGVVEPDGRAPGTTARKGRVSFGLARVVGEPRPLPPVSAVLGSPRANYYPNYLLHTDTPVGRVNVDSNGNVVYRTLMDPQARIRGWKRYRVHAEQPKSTPLAPRSLAPNAGGDAHNADMESRFEPLPRGTRFRGTMFLHNVRPYELGALLWAFDFGGHESARHTLGMAKSLGYGRIRVSRGSWDLERNDGADVQPDGCVAAFIDEMDRHLGGPGRFYASETIRQLLACATPAPSSELRHMRLQTTEGNEFVEAKKAGFTLAPAVPFETPGPSTASTSVASAPPTRPVAGRNPTVGESVEVEVVGRTKKGGLRFRIVATGVEGVLHPRSNPVGELQEGARLVLKVASGGTNPQFEVA